jgi:hypothetical protein
MATAIEITLATCNPRVAAFADQVYFVKGGTRPEAVWLMGIIKAAHGVCASHLMTATHGGSGTLTAGSRW